MLSLKLKMAWGMTEYDTALQELRKVHDWLASINQAAAESLDEGMEETLTSNRLNLPPQLRRIFSSTNLIESCFSRAGDLCRNVTHWRDGNMAQRWAARVLRDAQSRFRRLQAYSQLPQLINERKQEHEIVLQAFVFVDQKSEEGKLLRCMDGYVQPRRMR